MPLTVKTTLYNDLSYGVTAFARLSRGWALIDIGATAAMVIAPLGEVVEATSLWRAGETVAAADAAKAAWSVVSKGETITRSTISQISRKGTPVRSQETVEIHKVGPLQRFGSVSGVAGMLGAETVLIVVADKDGGRLAAVHTTPGTGWRIDNSGMTSDTGDRQSWVDADD